MIPMYRLWLHGLYGLYGPHCPLSPGRLLNLITHPLDNIEQTVSWRVKWDDLKLMWCKLDMLGWFMYMINTLRPRRNEQYFADDIFKPIFVNENVWISIKISLKFVPKGPINNIPALVPIMAWRRSGDKPLSEAMMVSLPTHICVTWPQWVNALRSALNEWIYNRFHDFDSYFIKVCYKWSSW